MGMTSCSPTPLAKSLRFAIADARAQLATCTTAAMRACVQGRIDDLERQLAALAAQVAA